ncbi:MAG: ROK family protein [Phycisphaerae bacterium]|nr:ROK family protein [Phycisphaerae bacterium]
MAAEEHFVGVDVGGTKIHAAVVSNAGVVLDRRREPTPREGGPDAILAAVVKTISRLLDDAKVGKTLQGVGLAVPGLLDYKKNRVDASPNTDISGLNLITPIRKTFDVPAAFANDTDAATLGEKWVGSAREANTAVGVFVGTGIGGGILVNRELLRGARYSAAEIGHIVMDIHGPVCGCGNRGCFEALAGRVAMERDIRRAISEGRPTVLAEWIGGADEPIRSGMLRRALDAGDELTKEVLTRAGEVMGQAAVTLRHIFEPDVIIFGGGVIEACGDFLMPLIESALAADPYFRRPGGRVVQSALGDDAGVLGAAAAAMMQAGCDPFDPEAVAFDHYPKLAMTKRDKVRADKKLLDGDLAVRVNGRVRKRDKDSDAPNLASAAELTCGDLDRACRGGPGILIIGANDSSPLPDACNEYLRRRAIASEILSPQKAIKRFNTLQARKAMLLLTGEAANA